jgi:hypothetical protein
MTASISAKCNRSLLKAMEALDQMKNVLIVTNNKVISYRKVHAVLLLNVVFVQDFLWEYWNLRTN